MKRIIFPLLLILGACVSVSLEKRISPTADRTLLFPPGVYTHQVDLETANQQKYSFRGLVKISSAKVTVVGLSPFQTTLFKVEEDRATKKVTAEIYQEALEKRRAALEEFYGMLSSFLTLPRNGQGARASGAEKNATGELKAVDVTLKNQKTRVEIVHYDSQGMADEFQILHPQFKVRVKVIGYEI